MTTFIGNASRLFAAVLAAFVAAEKMHEEVDLRSWWRLGAMLGVCFGLCILVAFGPPAWVVKRARHRPEPAAAVGEA